MVTIFNHLEVFLFRAHLEVFPFEHAFKGTSDVPYVPYFIKVVWNPPYFTKVGWKRPYFIKVG